MRIKNRHRAIGHGLVSLLAIHLLSLALTARCQTSIPIGTWRLHLSYNNIQLVDLAPARVFAASESGILIFDREQQSLSTYNKLNGLSNTGITSIRYHPETDQLLTGYADGGLDIIRGNTIAGFNRLKDAEVTTSKKINHISTHGDFAYLATAYGVVLFDVRKLEIKETWRDLGAAGETLPVYQSAFLNDTVYLATGNGVLTGNLMDNLLDFNNWKRYNSGDLSGPVRSIVSFNGKIYVAGATGIYRFGTDNWVPEPFLQTATIVSLTASEENLFLIADSAIWSMSRNMPGQISEITDELITAPAIIRQDEKGKYWVGDGLAGLVSNSGGSFSSYLPDGPSLTAVSRMVYEQGKLFVLSGGFTGSGEPLRIPGHLNVFENGAWTTVVQPFSDLTDIAFMDGSIYLATFGSGMAKTDASANVTMFDATNSPLVSQNPERSNIPAIETSANGLWVANFDGNEPLHLLKSDGSWASYAFGYPNGQNPTEIAIDAGGKVWMVLNPASGGGLVVFDLERNKGYYKTNLAGTGALPNMNVRCIATDQDGYTWVGTDSGVGYFYSETEDAIKPIYENRFLLRDEKITAIEVDGGNRKWIGTQEGVWLFDPAGEMLVHHFTPENSPLLSGVIRDIEINDETGEVFFATDHGIISYRGDAVAGSARFQDLKIFPNPVHPGFSGTVGIMGLSDNASVRITDISGKLIWQTKANGGMATWNVRDQNGKHAATGIYLVFASSEDGREGIVGKIAVIE